MSGKLKKLLSLALVCLMVLSIISPQLTVSATGSDDSNVTQTVKTNNNKPSPITDADVQKMSVRFYAAGTETINPNEEPYAVDLKIGTNVDYEIGEVYGNDEDGYSIDITFHFKSGDSMESIVREKLNDHRGLDSLPEWDGNWVYDFSQCSADQTITFKYRSIGIKGWYVPGSTI